MKSVPTRRMKATRARNPGNSTKRTCGHMACPLGKDSFSVGPGNILGALLAQLPLLGSTLCIDFNDLSGHDATTYHAQRSEWSNFKPSASGHSSP